MVNLLAIHIYRLITLYIYIYIFSRYSYIHCFIKSFVIGETRSGREQVRHAPGRRCLIPNSFLQNLAPDGYRGRWFPRCHAAKFISCYFNEHSSSTNPPWNNWSGRWKIEQPWLWVRGKGKGRCCTMPAQYPAIDFKFRAAPDWLPTDSRNRIFTRRKIID